MDKIFQAAEQNQDGALLIVGGIIVVVWLVCRTVKYVFDRMYPAVYEDDEDDDD